MGLTKYWESTPLELSNDNNIFKILLNITKKIQQTFQYRNLYINSLTHARISGLGTRLVCTWLCPASSGVLWVWNILWVRVFDICSMSTLGLLVSSNQSVTTMWRGQEGLTGFLSSCFVWQERDEKHWLNQGCSPRLKTMATSQILVTKQSYFRLILICGLKSNSKCVREKFDWIKVNYFRRMPSIPKKITNEHTIQCACIEKC